MKCNAKKKALIIRYGAYGDHLILTPVLTRLKELGYHVIFNTNKRGIDLFKNDSRVDEIIPHEEEMGLDQLYEHWEKLEKDTNADYFKNFTGSIENNLALHPVQPIYIKSKEDRALRCNKNYYEETVKWSGLEGCGLKPSIEFSEEEETDVKSCIKKDKFNILWCLSGSGRNKVYPWTEYVMGSLLKDDPNIHFITVGDTKCKILEHIFDNFPKENFTELSGEISMRKAMCLTKHVDLVISPDTGILHASGCFDTPKIGMLGHTTKENITKHFVNDYSIEANCDCSPCFYLIYDHAVQCPIEPVTKAAWCQSVGMDPETVYKQILLVKEKHGKKHST